ncbi:hypothetical protein ASE74_19480 [Pedobacter sp. Leaf216]|uniref:hypothetical protein n=1 Tax=Pedobacter sp. Leaf216 TaxID=1735684 RepID=UPI0006F35115|nr:hypothetical protein [Pedobacter sp. Leaf216]KQM76237.1 hypothetical protein ASE74_19480 [Pedobacter sp. Leaf216]
MKTLYLPNDTELFNKAILKRFKTALANLEIENDFLEISTTFKGIQVQVRVFGKADLMGKLHWHVIRIINQSVIPTQPFIRNN